MLALENEKLDLRCVAQSTLAIINGHVNTYFQEHPYIHDIAPTAYLASKAGLQVYVMPEIARKADSLKKDAYPFIFSDIDNLSNGML